MWHKAPSRPASYLLLSQTLHHWAWHLQKKGPQFTPKPPSSPASLAVCSPLSLHKDRQGNGLRLPSWRRGLDSKGTASGGVRSECPLLTGWAEWGTHLSG